jgi:hypothetical protein
MTMETKPAMTAMGTEMINVQYCYALYYTTAPQPASSVFRLKLELRCITRRSKAFLWGSERAYLLLSFPLSGRRSLGRTLGRGGQNVKASLLTFYLQADHSRVVL